MRRPSHLCCPIRGKFAKLQPLEGQDLMDGLAVKVQLGSVWKQSLMELSGGHQCVSIDSEGVQVWIY